MNSAIVALSDDQITAWVAAGLLPFFRIGSMLMIAPLFSNKTVPMRIRLTYALVITAIIVPLLPIPPPIDPLSIDAGLNVLNQILIGIAMGFTLRLIFSVAELGGQIIGQLMGLGFATLIDPQNGVPVPISSQFYTLLVTLIYLSLNGHLFSLQALIDSFQSLPVSIHGLAPEIWLDIAIWTGIILRGGLLIALPAIGVLMLINLMLAVASRAAPTLNIFSVGFPITLGVGLFVMLYTLFGINAQIESLLRAALEIIYGLPMHKVN